jgi:hypothetical protein
MERFETDLIKSSSVPNSPHHSGMSPTLEPAGKSTTSATNTAQKINAVQTSKLLGKILRIPLLTRERIAPCTYERLIDGASATKRY